MKVSWAGWTWPRRNKAKRHTFKETLYFSTLHVDILLLYEVNVVFVGPLPFNTWRQRHSCSTVQLDAHSSSCQMLDLLMIATKRWCLTGSTYFRGLLLLCENSTALFIGSIYWRLQVSHRGKQAFVILESLWLRWSEYCLTRCDLEQDAPLQLQKCRDLISL